MKRAIVLILTMIIGMTSGTFYDALYTDSTNFAISMDNEGLKKFKQVYMSFFIELLNRLKLPDVVMPKTKISSGYIHD